MKYETSEVIYSLKKVNNNYEVSAYYKEIGDTEENLFTIKEMEMQGEHYFIFIQLPPLTNINSLYDLRERSIQKLINRYEEFIEENY